LIEAKIWVFVSDFSLFSLHGCAMELKKKMKYGIKIQFYSQLKKV